MTKSKPWVVMAVVLALSGCVSSSVKKGAIVGAVSGAAAGAGVGALISNEHLLGTTSSKAAGDMSLEPGSAIAASVAVCAVFGGIIGAMIGRSKDDRDEVPASPSAAQARSTTPARPTAF
jgi:hypothetical protein